MSKYVISEDIDILLTNWGKKNNFSLPDDQFFDALRQEMKIFLESIFGEKNVDIVPSEELVDGVEELVHKSGVFPVAIDKVYFLTNLALEINRTVDMNLNERKLGPRFGFNPIQEQIRNIVQQCPNEIALVDDVVFSGNGIVEIIDLFNDLGIKVKAVVAGVVIGNGSEQLRRRGVEVHSVRSYSEVIDEIAERDFYPGVPLSGRLVIGPNYETGASYLFPFGKPVEWASVPEGRTKDFSIFCLNQTIKLWQKIEELSGKYVLITDLARWPFGITDKSIRVIEALKKAKEMLL